MAARTNLLGQWCSPTREITKTQLVRLIEETRHREAVAEVVHDPPNRECPTSAPERLENTPCSGMLIDLQPPDAPDAPARAQEGVAQDPGLPTLGSEPEVEPATAAFIYAPMMTNAMPPAPAPAPAQSIATAARRGRQRVARVRLLLGLGALLFLCLGLLAALGLAAWGATDASLSVSLGL